MNTFTLPTLEAHLAHMPIAKSLTLAGTDIERLFGFNDVAVRRLKNFARGHDCIVSYTDGCVVFHKVAKETIAGLRSGQKPRQ